jgi:hypothetical protein
MAKFGAKLGVFWILRMRGDGFDRAADRKDGGPRAHAKSFVYRANNATDYIYLIHH